MLAFLVCFVANTCIITPVRRLWAKSPASQSSLFAFERNGRVGFIDSKGKIVIDPAIHARIEAVGDFVDGWARVDHRGYIDQAGKWISQRDYAWTYDYSDGVAVVELNDPAEKSGRIGKVMDTSGKEVGTLPIFRTSEFSEGLAAYEAEGKPSIRSFQPGNFIYRDYPGPKGFLDKTGKVAIKATFADVGRFRTGLARAVLDGYCHIARPDGSIEGSPMSGYPTDCGGAPSDAFSPCKVGFINLEGKFVIPPIFESAQDFEEGLAAVRVNGRWGFIDRTGALVIPPQFEQAQSFREGLAGVKVNGNWGFTDPSGALRIPARFENVEPFSDSLAIAYFGKRPLFINRDGETQIAGRYREVTPFVHGLAAVLLNDKHVAYINHTGKHVFDYYRQ